MSKQQRTTGISYEIILRPHCNANLRQDREATIAKFGKALSPKHGAQRGEEQYSLLGRWFAELLQSSVPSTT